MPKKFATALLTFSAAMLMQAAVADEASVRTGGGPESACATYPEASHRKESVEVGLRRTVRFLNRDEPGFSLNQRLEAHKTPAVSVTLVDNNRVDWSASYGLMRRDSNEKVDCHTLFQAASLSKPVAMMAMMRMHERKQINLDADIDTYLKNYKLPQGKQSKDNPVTLRNILTHTSGITPGGFSGYTQEEAMPSDVEVVSATGITNSPRVEVTRTPGEQLMYSGGAYTLAELALQDIFDRPFEKIMQHWILSPVEMTGSDFSQPLVEPKRLLAAKGHTADGSAVEGGWNNHPEQAAAGLWSTSHDLAKFLIEIGKGYRGQSDVFSKALIDSMLTNPIAQHAYGFRLMGEGDTLALVHYGGTVGYRSGMVLSLASGDGAVFLTNSDNGSALINELLLSASAVYQWEHFKQIEMTESPVVIDALKNFIGDYKFEAQGWQVSVVYDDSEEQVAVVFPNDDRYLLVPTTKSKNHFVHADTGVEVGFEVEEDLVFIHLYGQKGDRQ